MSNTISRRNLLKLGAAAGVGAYLGSIFSSTAMAQNAGGKPHFFLFICYSGGIDPTYMFDARKLELTDAGLIQNYLYKNNEPGTAPENQVLTDATPLEFVGKNGNKTLRTALTDVLLPYKDDFTVINGIMMSPELDGHGSNMYYMWTGKTTGGGESFLPRIGANGKYPLDSIHLGGWAGDGNQAPTNFSTSAQFDPRNGGGFSSLLSSRAGIELASPDMKFIRERLGKHENQNGLFSRGANMVNEGLDRAPQLEGALKNMNYVGNLGVEVGQLKSALEFAVSNFKGGVTQAFSIMMNTDMAGSEDFDLDTHDGSLAQQQARVYRAVINDIKEVFEFLKNTAFDETSSLFDVTTLVITSEFARTMRQEGSEIGATGTDHNPLTNSMLVAGKGIKGGLVVGASDLTDIDAEKNLKDVSGAHRELDSELIKIMAKPFDFATQQVRSDLPEKFAVEDYITFPSVANTFLKLFNVSEEKYVRLPSGKNAPTLEILS